ncbi:unnamed protein product, partial [Sphacelaria rigidula]
IFAACTAGHEEVIPAVLSLYVRRGRLPQPGEVVFCTSNTTEEELELVVRRFAARRSRTAAATLFVIADVHRLSYSTQFELLGHLRSKVLENDGEDTFAGGVLLVISGEPRQALLSWLSGHIVEVPPLPADALRKAVSYAL